MSGKRAALYLRVSSPGQADDGYSLDGQRMVGRDYCDRYGYRVSRIFSEAKSGKDDGRPVFQYMLQLAKRGAFDVLVVWRRDRYFRNAIEAGYWERRLKAWGVRIESVQSGPQEDTRQQRFFNLMVDGIAELERGDIAERLALGRMTAARQGLWPTEAPFGYRKTVPGKAAPLDIVLEEAVKVREAYRECIRGANRARLGHIFGIDPRSAPRRLRNPAYKGQADYGGVTVPCPAIVDEATWQAAQDAMDARFQGCDHNGRLLSARASG